MATYFRRSLMSVREISGEASAPRTLPAATVGLGAAPTGSAQRGRWCKGGSMAMGCSVRGCLLLWRKWAGNGAI
jgi:hypothetical protein